MSHRPEISPAAAGAPCSRTPPLKGRVQPGQTGKADKQTATDRQTDREDDRQQEGRLNDMTTDGHPGKQSTEHADTYCTQGEKDTEAEIDRQTDRQTDRWS